MTRAIRLAAAVSVLTAAAVGGFLAGAAHADDAWRVYVPDHVTTVCADDECWPLPHARP